VESRDLAASAARGVVIRCEGGPIVEIPPAWRGRLVRRPGGADSEFELSGGLEINAVLDWLLRSGVRVRAVSPQGSGLEELFLAATEGEAPRPGGDAPHGQGPRSRSGGDRTLPEGKAEPGPEVPGPERAASTLEGERRAA
jgi:hypothetical protein